jgi:serine/threonine protein kinase
MAYLERRKIVHRDLAARFTFVCLAVFTFSNVLVSKEGLSKVKLSDVGLSRTLAGSDYYRKASNMKACI